MKVLGAYEKARQYIEVHNTDENDPAVRMRKLNPGPCITVSRETGIGAETICSLLINYLLRYANQVYGNWAYFDKNLMEKIIADHDLPAHFRSFLENERPPSIDTMWGEIIKSHPSTLKLLHNTSQTILQLAKYGNAIIIGRGANIITHELTNAFHVRLIAPVKFRVANAQDLYSMDKKTATQFIEKEDRTRKEFIKNYFHKDIDDPQNYHLMLNTYLMSFEEVAETIGGIIVKKYPFAFVKENE